MRVTLLSAVREAEIRLQRVEQELATRTQELSSGRRLNKLSDDPFDSANAIIKRGEATRIDSYERAADSVDSRLSIVDSLLSDVISLITVAQTSAVASRSSVVTAEQREAYAGAIEGIRDTILADVNTQYRGAYIFSGAATATAPYTKTGGTVSAYQGGATEVHVDVGRNTAIKISMNGDELVRGSDTNDLFTELDALVTAVRAGDSVGIDTGLQALGRALSRATTAQSRVGNDLRVVSDQRFRLGARRVETVLEVARLEDANLVESITGLQAAELAYQATVRAIGLQLPLSLIDFVR